MKTESDVLTVSDVARYLQVHTGTIYRLLRARQIPAFKLGGGWRFRKAQIDEWVKKLHFRSR
jgi:excisionase family DNA binding protein